MAAEPTDTIIGAQVEMKGSLKNSGPIHIFGKVTGDVSSDALVLVGESAIVIGPINAKQVDVSGQVQGPIVAEEMLEMQAKSIVKGDVTAGRLSIKPGAIFIGKSQMTVDKSSSVLQEPIKEDSDEAGDKKRPHLEIE